MRRITMLNSEQRHEAPLSAQVDFWNKWNADTREGSVGDVSIDQAKIISSWLRALDRTDLDIIDVGCGAGWLCERLTPFGKVTGIDLADEVIARAAERVPSARFVAGDFMALDFGKEAFDVVTSLEVLPHVTDQPAFISKIADLLRPGGYLMLAVQNRPALEKNDIPPAAPGQIRHWVDRFELRDLLGDRFDVQQMFSLTPKFNRGSLRLLNSHKLHALLRNIGLAAVSRAIKKRQEQAWLGWTLMALARKRAETS